MTSTAYGNIAIDDCVGTGSCPRYCGNAACSKNAYMIAYPNYAGCSGVSCTDQTNLPRVTKCGASLSVTSRCNVTTTARLWECGPAAGQSTPNCNYGCFQTPLSCSQPYVACGNVALLTHLLNGKNPYSYGTVAATISF